MKNKLTVNSLQFTAKAVSGLSTVSCLLSADFAGGKIL